MLFPNLYTDIHWKIMHNPFFPFSFSWWIFDSFWQHIFLLYPYEVCTFASKVLLMCSWTIWGYVWQSIRLPVMLCSLECFNTQCTLNSTVMNNIIIEFELINKVWTTIYNLNPGSLPVIRLFTLTRKWLFHWKGAANRKVFPLCKQIYNFMLQSCFITIEIWLECEMDSGKNMFSDIKTCRGLQHV